MSYATKAKVLTTALLILGAWPVVHCFLVKRYDVNAWKFAGWAMYSRLGPEVLLTLGVTRDGQYEELAWSSLPPPLREAAAKYRWRTGQYGLLASPDPLAAALLKEFPGAEAVAIQRHSPFLDPEVDRLLVRRATFCYGRGGKQRVDDAIVQRHVEQHVEAPNRSRIPPSCPSSPRISAR